MVRFLQRQGVTGNNPWQRTLPHMLLGAGLSSVAILGSWGTVTWAVAWADQLTAGAAQAKEATQIWMSVGAIVGTLTGALVGQWLDRRPAFFLYCALSLAAVGNLFLLNHGYGPWFLVSTFFGGACVASFYGWLPLYLPELFHTSVRATGQGFAFNFGRMLAAVGILQAGNLMTFFTQDVEFAGLTVARGYPATCTVMSLVYVVGMVIIWLAPETRGAELPD